MTARNKAWMLMIIIAVVEVLPLFLVASRSVTRFFVWLGFSPGGNHGTWLGWIFAAMTSIAFTAYAVRSLALVREYFTQVDLMKIFAVTIFAPITGTFEEVYFRRVLMDGLASHRAQVALQVATSAVLFGLAHAVWALFGGKWRVGINAMLSTTALGGLLGFVYVTSGRSLAPCIAAHFAINALIEPWLLLAAISAPSKRVDS